MTESNSYETDRVASSGVGSYSLRWNSFQAHLTEGMGKMLENDEFTDVTLACDAQFLKAHKLILSLCSPYFKRLFQANNGDKNGTTIVILNNVRFIDLENIIRFIYHGEANVNPADLNRFIKTGELLQIEGLAQTKLPHKGPAPADNGMADLSKPLASRLLSGLANEARTASKGSLEKTPINRTLARQKSLNELRSAEPMLVPPPSKRAKTASTLPATSRLQSILAGIANAACIAATKPVGDRPEAHRTANVSSCHNTATIAIESSNADHDDGLGLQQERDPLELSNVQQPICVELASDSEDEHFANSDFYSNSNHGGSGTEDNNGTYALTTDETSFEGPTPSHHGSRDFQNPSNSSTPRLVQQLPDLSGRTNSTRINDSPDNIDADCSQIPYYLPSYGGLNAEEMATCTTCKASVPWINFSEHMSSVHAVLNVQNHLSGRVECPICFRLLKNKNSLKVHKSIYHRATKPVGDAKPDAVETDTPSGVAEVQEEILIKSEVSNCSD